MSTSDLAWVEQQAQANSGRLAELNRALRGLRLATRLVERRLRQAQHTQAMYAMAIEESRTVRVDGLLHGNADIYDAAGVCNG